MASFGFITDKLEIKFLILYIASRLVGPVPFETLQDLSMCDGGVDYFDFAECLADLVRTEHLSKSEEGPLRRHGQGAPQTAPSARAACPTPCGCRWTRTSWATTSRSSGRPWWGPGWTSGAEGGCTVTLSLSDELDDLMELKLLVTREDMAKEMQKTFQAHAEEIYTKILAVLYGGGA